jgi:hypothetical protein
LVTVRNVAPTVDAGSDQFVDEAVVIFLDPATFNDLGTLDTHTAVIDWGDGTEDDPAAVAESPFGPPGSTAGADGTVSGTHVYGDNGVYVVTVTVTDDDGGVGTDTLEVEVTNVDPFLVFDETGIIPFGDFLAFLGRADESQTHAASASDDGSDDITFLWTHTLDATPVTFAIHPKFNNGVSPEPPLPTQTPDGVFPFSASDTATVSFEFFGPGVYTLTAWAIDDDGGSHFSQREKIVTDACDDCGRSQGFWAHQFSGKGKQHIDDATLARYMDITRAASRLFDELPLAFTTKADGDNVFRPTGPDVGDPLKSNPRGKAIKQLAAAWMNFAVGGVGWNEIIPDGQTFAEAIVGIEDVLLDDNASANDYRRAGALAEAINLMDGG